MTRPSQVQRALALACQAAIESLLKARASDQDRLDTFRIAGDPSALEEAWATYQLATFVDVQGHRPGHKLNCPRRRAALVARRDKLAARDLPDDRESSP
jgi:hypothetical protein